MSGDSPNAFTNENVFDFREGRSSPTPMTSKDPSYVTASVLVEKQKEKKDKDKEDDEDSPDFSSPTLNPGAEKENRRPSDAKKESNEPKSEDSKHGEKKEEQNLLNGGLDRLPSLGARKDYEDDSEEDTCIVNCIYYTMECCKCSIV